MGRRTSAFLALGFVYLVSRAFWAALDASRGGLLDSAVAVGLLKVGLWVVPATLLLMMVGRHRVRGAARWLGLGRGFSRGYAFALAATLPMALVVLLGGWPSTPADVVLDTLVLGPFAEEVLFRGFLLTWLIRYAGWRPLTAILVSAIFFGMAHADAVAGTLAAAFVRPLFGLSPLWTPMLNTLGMTAVFGAGGVLFGWIYVRWGSLWPAIGLHACINLWWDLSVGSETPDVTMPLAGLMPLAQALAVVLAIGITNRQTGSVDREIGSSGDRGIGTDRRSGDRVIG